MVITSFNQPSAITHFILQPDGEIIASGKTSSSLDDVTPDQLNIALARYTTRGQLDSTFNQTGKNIINLNDDAAVPNSQLFQSDILVVDSAASSDTVIKLNNYNADYSEVASTTTKGNILAAGNNGTDTTEANILTAGLDLTTQVLSALPTTVLAGVKGTASVSIKESGTTDAITSVTLKIQFATDSYGDGAVTVESLSEHISLRQGQFHLYKVAFAYPSVSTSGGFYLVATVTELPSITDLNLNNNLAPSDSPVIVAPPTIELAGSGLSATSIFASGKSASVQFNLANNGNVTAKGKTEAELYLSANQTIADGTQIISLPLVIGLPAGKSHVYRLKFILPSTVSAGSVYLLAIIDPTNNLGSTDHSDSHVVDGSQISIT